MTKEEFVRNLMENDREGIGLMTEDRAAEILDWIRGDDEDNQIPQDLTAVELTEIWNSMKQ